MFMRLSCSHMGTGDWQKLVDETDAQIGLLSENEDNMPDTRTQGLNVMKPSSKQQAETREAQQRQENAKKAKEVADKLFPGENWKQVEDGIYLSPHRAIGKNSSYKGELKDAQILKRFGSTIYLTPESRSAPGKKFDAIVNGLKFEFKDISGNANTLEHQFLRSRSQAPNVFINLEKSSLTRREIMSTLFGARNKPETEKIRGYAHYNRFKGGRIILKIRGQENLIYLNADDLKI